MGRADVLPFWFGESDQPTADYIRAAAVQSLDAGETFYSQNLGRPYLREAIAAYLGRLHGRPLDAARVGVVASGDTGLMVTMQLLLSPGDRVVAVTPLWPNICEMPRCWVPRWCGCRCRPPKAAGTWTWTACWPR
jgi:aspartate/methionine/tyrosine aminotransferase